MSYQKAFLAAVYTAAIFVMIFSVHSASTCGAKYKKDIKINVGSKTINAELASTITDLTTGLGGRSCIGSNQAMLFDYKVLSRDNYISVWMQGMHFPIDIIWINKDKQIVKVESNIFPASYPRSFVNTKPASYVLEVKSGQAKASGIKTGTLLKF